MTYKSWWEGSGLAAQTALELLLFMLIAIAIVFIAFWRDR